MDTVRTSRNNITIANDTARFAIDPDDGRGHGLERRGEPGVASQPLDVRGAEEDEQEARRERRPHRHGRAQEPGDDRWESPGCWYAPTKPTNSSTMISGPGSISARPRPTVIWPGWSHPYVPTAAWST